MRRGRLSLLLLLLCTACSRDLSLPEVASGVPERISDLRVSGSDGDVTLLFTAPSVGGQRVAGYELRLAARELADPAAFASWSELASPAPSAPGSPEQVRVTGALPQAEATCFAIRARSATQVGPLSEVACLDAIPPDAPVLSGAPAPEGRALLLTFSPPAAPDLDGYLLLRAAGTLPTEPPARGARPAPGETVGGATVVAAPGPEDRSVRDGSPDGAPLTDELSYGYALHARDLGGNWSAASVVLLSPHDSLPPPEPAAFAAEGIGEGKIRLDWTLTPDPTDPRPLAVTLLRRADAPPEEEPVSGEPYAAGSAVGEAEVIYDGPAGSFTDPALTPGVSYHYALYARDAAHNRGAPVRAAQVAVAGPAIEGLMVEPGFARAGAAVEVRFVLSGPPEPAPVVTVGAVYALPRAPPLAAPWEFVFDYRTSGQEPEGQGIPVVVSAQDATGSSERRAQLVFDFTPPELTAVTVTPRFVGRDRGATVALTADEPLAAGSEVLLRGAPLACAAGADGGLSCEVPAATGAEPEGEAPLTLALRDRAGNPAAPLTPELAAAAQVTYDFTARFAPELVGIERRAGGSSAVVLNAGAVEPFSSLALFTDAAGLSPLGTIPADQAGLGPALALAEEPPALYGRMTDAAGNRSRLLPILRREVLADLTGRVAGSASGNPSRLLQLTTSRLSLDDLELGQAREVLQPAYDGAAVAGGASATSSAAPTGAGAWTVEAEEPPRVLDPAVASYRSGGAGDVDRVVIFAGRDGAGQARDDTWEFDGQQLRRVAVNGPPPPARSGAVLVFDEYRSRLLLFGGEAGGTLFGDSWEYDPRAAAWTDVTPAAGNPPARSRAVGWFDPEPAGTGTFALFGGRSAAGAAIRDFWLFDPVAGSWRASTIPVASLPPGRYGAAGGLWKDPQAGEPATALIWGGSPPLPCSTWIFYRPVIGGTASWFDIGPMEFEPSGCGEGSALVAAWGSPVSSRLHMTGGAGIERDGSATSTYDWYHFTNSVPPRRRHGLGIHASSGRFLSVGGEDADGVLQGAFTFQDSRDQWGDVTYFDEPTGLYPTARAAPLLARPAGRDEVVLFGGVGGEGQVADGWAFGAGAVLPIGGLQPALSPRAVLVPHQTLGLLLLQPDTFPPQTFAYSGAWGSAAATRHPPGDVGFGIAGRDGSGSFVSDGTVSWRYVSDWAPVAVTGPLDPSLRWRGLAADPRDGLLAVAGSGGATARWTGTGFEQLQAFPPAPDDARPVVDTGRVRAVHTLPSGELGVVEWAGGGWVPRSGAGAPLLSAPAAATAPGGPGLFVTGDAGRADSYRFTAPGPVALPHLLAELEVSGAGALAELRVSATAGGTGTAGDGGRCHGAVLFAQLPGTAEAWLVGHTAAPADAPERIERSFTGAEAAALGAGGVVRLVAAPACAAEALGATIALDHVEARAVYPAP